MVPSEGTDSGSIPDGTTFIFAHVSRKPDETCLCPIARVDFIGGIHRRVRQADLVERRSFGLVPDVVRELADVGVAGCVEKTETVV